MSDTDQTHAFPFVWDLLPLSKGAWANQRADTDAPPGGHFTLRKRKSPRVTGPWARGDGGYLTLKRGMYRPAPDDLAILRCAFPDHEPEQPIWANIEALLIIAGHAKAELIELNAPTLLRLLAKANKSDRVRGKAEHERRDWPYPYGSDLHWLWGWAERIDSWLIDGSLTNRHLRGVFRPDRLADKAITRLGDQFPHAFGLIASDLKEVDTCFDQEDGGEDKQEEVAEAMAKLRDRIRETARLVSDVGSGKAVVEETNTKTQHQTTSELKEPYMPADWFRDKFGIPASMDGPLTAFSIRRRIPRFIKLIPSRGSRKSNQKVMSWSPC